jgi:hypothetical protein
MDLVIFTTYSYIFDLSVTIYFRSKFCPQKVLHDQHLDILPRQGSCPKVQSAISCSPEARNGDKHQKCDGECAGDTVNQDTR